MKKKILLILSLFVALAMSAQDEILQKYTEQGDVNTIYVSKGMLSQIPLDQFDVPGLKELVGKIDHMKILVSRGDNMGKKMGTKLPKQLASKGYVTRFDKTQDGKQVRIMQMPKDPTHIAIIVYAKPQATVVSMKGDFSEASINSLLPTTGE